MFLLIYLPYSGEKNIFNEFLCFISICYIPTPSSSIFQNRGKAVCCLPYLSLQVIMYLTFV
jgi:hypothetical protein